MKYVWFWPYLVSLVMQIQLQYNNCMISEQLQQFAAVAHLLEDLKAMVTQTVRQKQKM